MVKIAVELERSMQRPLLWQETEGTVASSRFPIHYNTFYMVHASACDILINDLLTLSNLLWGNIIKCRDNLSTVILAVIIILFYDTLLIIGATY